MRRALSIALAVALLPLAAAATSHAPLDFVACGPLDPRAAYCGRSGCMSIDPIVITVRADGAVQWNGVLVTHETLLSYLHSAVADTPQPAFTLRAQGNVSYATFARVLLLFQRGGIKFMTCEVPPA